jgi:signal transduction histidine kinase
VRALRIGLAVAAVPFGLYGYHLLVHDLDGSAANAIASIGVAWIFIAAGLIAWGLRPRSGVGPLMIFVGYALLFRKLQYSHDPRVFTAGFALGEIGLTAAYAHVALSYPSGTLRSRLDRWSVVGGYAAVIAFPVAMLLVLDHEQTCIFDNCPPPQARSVIAIAPSSRAFDAIEDVYRIFVYGALTVLFVALIGRRLWRATPRGRRLLAPLVVAAVFMATRGVFGAVVQIVGTSGRASELIYSWQIAGQIALPIALLVGLLTARLAKGTIADIVLELGKTPPTGVRQVLARALGDPTLDVAFWLPERRGYVDIDGAPVALPTDHRDEPSGAPHHGRRFRAVTYLTHDGEPVAALVHDPSLRDEPGLVEAAGEAAVLALENARLQADVRAQLAKVQESRRRIVTAGDERARTIERNIHDGAQQRLVALALELRIAQRQHRDKLDPEIERLLEDAVAALQVAVDELRELARGVHPAVLTEDGLAGAIDSLAARTHIPVKVSAVPEERLPQEIEAAAYFVVSEAMTNAVKHAQASRLEVSAQRVDGRLVVSVEDDGVGGADETAGTGLRGLVDRVEAHGGTLRIVSPPGRGTRVVGELPCAS